MSRKRSRSRDSHHIRKKDEDDRENREYRPRTPILDRERRIVERSQERRISRESRDRQERRQLEERVEERRAEEFRENRFKTWSNEYGHHRRARTYYEKDFKGKQNWKTESRREEKPQEPQEKLEIEQKETKGEREKTKRSRKKEPESQESDSDSDSSDSEASCDRKEKEKLIMMKEIYKLYKQRQKEKKQKRKGTIRAQKARKSPSGNLARDNSPDSVSGYMSSRLYEQETPIVQPIEVDTKDSKKTTIQEDKKVIEKASTKQVAVIIPQVIATPDPPAPELVEEMEEDNQFQEIEEGEDLPEFAGEVVLNQQFIVNVPEEEFEPRYSPIEPTYSPNEPEYSPPSSPIYPPQESTDPDN